MHNIDGGSSNREGAVKVIKTKEEHEAALAQIDALLDRDPTPGTAEADKLELLSFLVEEYEAQTWSMEIPDPVDAVVFRMEQQGLRQRDLVAYLGSRSKVSEVLARKRPLTLSMMRALHKGLGIPAEVLLQERDPSVLDELEIEWDQFPVREMIKRGWIGAGGRGARGQAEELLRQFFQPVGGIAACSALYRRTGHFRSARQMNSFALVAWTARILMQALERPAPGSYEPGSVTMDFMREVARLSWFDIGPKLAQEFLGRHGIALVVAPHLPHTHLDGAAVLAQHLSAPVIGVTVRHDRLDNFWFCLMHELAHVSRHLHGDSQVFYDDLDVPATDDKLEKEADEIAGEALIPGNAWDRSPARVVHSPKAVQHLANQLRVHPAIVAGRIRHETKKFQILNNLVGQGEVRRLFPEVTW